MLDLPKFVPLRNGNKDPKLAALENTERLQPKRVRDRYAEHARRQARAYQDQLAQAPNSAARAAIDAAYERAAAETPVGHHSGSSFAPPYNNQLDEAGQSAILTAFVRAAWKRWRGLRQKGEAFLPAGLQRLLKTLTDLAVRHGTVYATQATLAELSGLSERTVRRHLDWLKAEGFVTWRRRLVWTEDALGVRKPRQTSNSYCLVALSALHKAGATLLNTLGRSRITRRPPTMAERARQLLTATADAFRAPLVAATSGRDGRLAWASVAPITQHMAETPERGGAG